MTPLPDGGDWRPSRRALLRTAGASLAALTSGTAGCMSTLPPLGQRVRFGRVDAPPRAAPRYSDWLPRPGALHHDDGEGTDPLAGAMYVTPGDLGVDETGAHVTIGESVMRTQVDYFGMGFDSYDWALAPDPGVVMAGDVDTAAVHETLTETVYERAGSHLDFDLFRRTDRPHVVAVSGTHVVFDAGENAEANVRTLVDTGRGRGERYVDVDADARQFVGTVGASPFIWYGFGTAGLSGDAEGALDVDPVAAAHSYLYDEDAVFFVFDQLYREDSVPTVAEARHALEGRTRALRAAGVEVTRQGRHVTVEMRAEVADLRQGAGEPLIAPQITWTAAYDAAADRLTLSHQGGDAVDASRLVVHPSGSDVGDRLSPASGQIGPGDDLTVDLTGIPDEADTVQIVLEQQDGQSSATIYSFEVPDADSEAGPTDESES